MSIQENTVTGYSIQEAAKLSGLPESTLRYYESIGVIDPIHRDVSSKHRVYSEDDINMVVAVACLNATGMSIDDMRTYLKNRVRGAAAADEQVSLLAAQKHKLAEEAHFLELRQRYVDTKIAYWKAVKAGSEVDVAMIRAKADAIAKELKSPRDI